MTTAIDRLLTSYPLVSGQVNKDQVRVILYELERVLEKGVDGAIVELGCYIGTTSLFIRRLLDLQEDEREFHVYDSFEGLPTKSPLDASRAGEQFQAGELAVSKKQLLREFQKVQLTPPIIHKGWFHNLTTADMPEQIGFAFLDGDFYQSIHDSLWLTMAAMQEGGTIVVDDYAREALPGVAKAVHERFRPAQVTTSHNLGVIRL